MADKLPNKLLLFNDGQSTIDGLEHLTMNRKIAERIIARFHERGIKLVIDYRHSTEKEDGKALAAGWAADLEYVKGEGLWATNIEWTEDAKREILANQVRYWSPAFAVERSSQEIVEVTSVALTNTPATNEQTELLRQAAQSGATGLVRLYGAVRQILEVRTMTKKNKVAKPKLYRVTAQADAVEKLKVLAEEQDLDIEVEALPEEDADKVLDVGAAIQALAEALGVDPATDAVEIINQAIAALGQPKEPKEPEEPAGASGDDEKRRRAQEAELRVKAEQVPDLVKRIKDLEAHKAERDAESKSDRIDKMLADQVDAGKLNPHNEKQMASAKDLAESDEPRFVKLFAEMEPIADPGTLVASGGGPKGGRERVIAEARKTWKTEGVRSSEKAYVGVLLEENGEQDVTDEEWAAVTAQKE